MSIQTKLSTYSNLTQRVIAAVIGVTVIITAVVYSQWSYLFLFCAIGAFTQIEFYKLLGLDGNQPLTYYGTAVGVFINILTFLIEQEILPYEDYYFMVPPLTIIFFIKLYKKKA